MNFSGTVFFTSVTPLHSVSYLQWVFFVSVVLLMHLNLFFDTSFLAKDET